MSISAFSRAEIAALKSWVPRHHRFGSFPTCTYCGDTAEALDHVVPYSLLFTKKRVNSETGKGLVCVSCTDCNTHLSNLYYSSMRARLDAAHKSLEKRFSRFLKYEECTRIEIQELGYALRSDLEYGLNVKAHTQRRIRWRYSDELAEIMREALEQVRAEYPDNKQLHDFLAFP